MLVDLIGSPEAQTSAARRSEAAWEKIIRTNAGSERWRGMGVFLEMRTVDAEIYRPGRVGHCALRRIPAQQIFLETRQAVAVRIA